MKKMHDPRRKSASSTQDQYRAPPLNPEEEALLGKAANYCLRNFPMLWTVGGIREDMGVDGTRRWIVSVVLRYPTGHEGHIGDLLFNGQQFQEVTTRELMRERAEQIASDPERERKWNDLRSSPLPTGEG